MKPDEADAGMNRRTVVDTDRTGITTWLPADLHDLAALHADPATMRFIGHGRPETMDETRIRLREYRNEQQTRGWTKWRVENHAGDMIGRAGFGEVDGSRELAYALRPDHWGRGYGTEIAVALVRWHRDHSPCDLPSSSLCAHVEVGNHASVRISTRLVSSSWTRACTRASSVSSYS